MLNELYQLSNTLKTHSIRSDTWHREYAKLPIATSKAPCFRIWITKQGSISSIDQLEPELVRTLRKYGSKQASYPAFNIKPLYRLTNEGRQRNDNWHKSLKRIDKSLRTICGKFTDAMGYDDDNVDESIEVQLVESTLKLVEYGFRNALEEYITTAIAEGNEKLRYILEFNSAGDKPDDKDNGKDISVILDLVEWREYGYPIASEETTKRINSALFHAESGGATQQAFTRHDVFGMPFDEAPRSEPMPEVSISGLKVILRSMFYGQPCQRRYGRFADASYPISPENRYATKGALEWVAREENEHITWVKADKNEVVFAYPSELPDKDICYAAVFGGIGAKGRFEELSKDFIKAFKAVTPDKQPKNIRVFSIRKMDKARTKVVYTRNLQPKGFIQAAVEWRNGCRNIPFIVGSDEKTPFPLDMARIVNTIWKQDGEQIRKKDGTEIVKRMQIYQGIEFMFDTDGSSVPYYMSILVSNVFGLVIYAGSNRIFSDYYAKVIAEETAILGLLLYRNDSRKEVYMKDIAYLTGQLLKASDELHELYSMVVREGNVPPQLIGASMLTAASDTPDKALSQLSIRIHPYMTWAKSYRYKRFKGDEAKEKQSQKADRLVKQFEDIASQLYKVFNESIRFTDFEKAQLFLGYLAAIPIGIDIDI